MSVQVNDQNLGHATAYGYALSKGYTGTEDEFAELMASYADVAEQAAESAEQAEASATTATAKASEAAQSATAAASSKTAAETAQGGAETAAQTATTKAGEASTAATTATNKATEASTAATTATGKATEAAGSATTATTKAGEASTSATNAAASATRAQEILDSIPEDYSQLSDDVSDLKDGLTAVESDVTDLKEEFTSLDEHTFYNMLTGTWLTGKAINVTTGAEYDSAVFDYMIVTIPEDTVGYVGILSTVWSPAADIAFYDSNNTFIVGYAKSASTTPTEPLYAEIPSNAKTARVCCRKETQFKAQARLFYSSNRSIDYVSDKYDNVYACNINDLVFTETNGIRLLSTGATNRTVGWTSSNLIPVKVGQIITYNRKSVTLEACFYDSSESFISYVASTFGMIVPKNAAYVRLGINAATMKNLGIHIYEPEIHTIDEPIVSINKMRFTNNWFVYDNASYWSTWFIDVSDVEQIIAELKSPTYNGAVRFWDGDFNYISAVTLYRYNYTPYTVVSIPSTAKYITVEALSDLSENLFISPKYRDVYIGTGREYTSILKAMMSELGAVRFIVESGTYNVVNEYKAEYGNDFWEEYEGYTGKTDVFLRGYTPLPYQQMIFRQGAKVVFDYSGENENVFIQFSVFNLTMNNVLDGVDCDFGERIARYCIHDDQAGIPGTNIIKNCTFRGTSYNGPVIGGGCGTSNQYEIEHCLFENNDGTADVMYHNALASGAVNRVHVRDCYGKKGVIFLYCGASTIVSDFIVSNSKFQSITLSPHPSVAHENVNVRLVEYCNDKTPVN